MPLFLKKKSLTTSKQDSLLQLMCLEMKYELAQRLIHSSCIST